MMIQRTRSAGAANAVAIAGNAMFIMESSDTTSAPAAAVHRDIARMMTRHARSDRLGGAVRRGAGRLSGRRGRRIRRRDHRAVFLGIIEALLVAMGLQALLVPR